MRRLFLCLLALTGCCLPARAQADLPPLNAFFNEHFDWQRGKYLGIVRALDSVRSQYAATEQEGMHRYYTGLAASWFANTARRATIKVQLDTVDGLGYADALTELHSTPGTELFLIIKTGATTVYGEADGASR